MNSLSCVFRVPLLVALSCTGATADTWPGFRGAAGTGVSREGNLPVSWSEGYGVAWGVSLPGRGNSSPAVTSNRVYLTTQDANQQLWVVACERRRSGDSESGTILWQLPVGRGVLSATGAKNLYEHRHNAATCSPAADEEHVWALFGTGLLVCVTKDGRIIWSKDMTKEYGGYDIAFGMASSPRLWGDRLFVACMNKGPSYVVAFEKSTGRQIWKKDRQFPARVDGNDGYSTPAIIDDGRAAQLLVSGADHVNAYDVRTGEVIWTSGGLAIDSPFGRVIASPATSNEVIVATSGNPTGSGLGILLALKPGGTGNITQSHLLWKADRQTPDSSTPVCYDGKVYIVSHEGIGCCYEARSGRQFWRNRIGEGPYHSSLVAGDGKVYFLNIHGECTVVSANATGQVLAKSKIADTFYATPAISDGMIYLRGYRRLYAISGVN